VLFRSPDPSTNGNGNGHTNGHDQIFRLQRTTDPDTLAILKSREAALKDPKLNRSEKSFVCFAIDRALHPDAYRNFEKGVTCIADSIVAEIFGVTERTVYNWRHNEAIRAYIWFSKTRRPDKWAMMVYHLSALHPPPVEKTEWIDPAGGSYAAGAKARPPEPNPDKAAQGRATRNARLATKRAQQTLALPGGLAVVTGNSAPPPLPESAVLQGISADSRSNFRPTAETDFGSQPKPISADSRNGFRLTAETNFGCEPKPISAVSRKTLRSPAETGCRYKEPEKELQKLTKKGGEGTPPSSSCAKDEKIAWNGRRWWQSHLFKQLSLLDESIKALSGEDRRKAQALRTSLLVALGLPAPSPRTPSPAPPASVPAFKAPTPDQLANYIADLRKAAQ